MNKFSAVLWAFIAIQFFGASFFLFDFLASTLVVQRLPMSWQVREAMEISAALALVIGCVLGVLLAASTQRRENQAEELVQLTSGAFARIVSQRFHKMGLTQAEHDVAWFLLKGFSLAEISELRGTSQGTIKAQTSSIYRKARVKGRSQLVADFVEDLLPDTPPEFLSDALDQADVKSTNQAMVKPAISH